MGRHTRQSDDELPPPQAPAENVYSRAYQPPTYGVGAPTYGPDPRSFDASRQAGPADDAPTSTYYGRVPITAPNPIVEPPAGTFPAVPRSEQYDSPYTRAYDKIDLGDGQNEPDDDEEPHRSHWLTRIPLLPSLAGIAAIGMIAAAWSTSNISLNFGGGTVPGQQTGQGDTTRGPKASRGGGRVGAVTVAFSSVKLATGFKGTVTLHNRGARTISSWTLKFHLEGAKVVGVSGGILAKVSATPTIRQAKAALSPGETAKVIYTAQGAVVTPTGCTFNGASCGA